MAPQRAPWPVAGIEQQGQDRGAESLGAEGDEGAGDGPSARDEGDLLGDDLRTSGFGGHGSTGEDAGQQGDR